MKEKVVTFLKRENYYFSLTARKTKLVFLLHDYMFYITLPSQLNYLKVNNIKCKLINQDFGHHFA